MKKIIISILLATLVLSGVFAQGIPDKQNPPRLVNDFASVLSKKEVNNLENALEAFARETSTQIVIVTVNSIEGDISDFAFKLGEKWGVGQKKDNNGVVIVLKPKRGTERGQVFVATGYGIEHLIPDAIANRDIVDNEMIPRFKQNDYYGGLVRGVKVIMDLTRGEYTAAAYHQEVKNSKGGSPFFFLFLILIFVIIPILRGRRGRHYSGGRSLPFWLLLGMMGSGRSMHSGSFSNFSSGSGGFGGGFGGFGGGGFGGGGAGGSW